MSELTLDQLKNIESVYGNYQDSNPMFRFNAETQCAWDAVRAMIDRFPKPELPSVGDEVYFRGGVMNDWTFFGAAVVEAVSGPDVTVVSSQGTKTLPLSWVQKKKPA